MTAYQLCNDFINTRRDIQNNAETLTVLKIEDSRFAKQFRIIMDEVKSLNNKFYEKAGVYEYLNDDVRFVSEEFSTNMYLQLIDNIEYKGPQKFISILFDIKREQIKMINLFFNYQGLRK